MDRFHFRHTPRVQINGNDRASGFWRHARFKQDVRVLASTR